ncbi:MAG: beta family protein [Nocardioidaceae bacterium]
MGQIADGAGPVVALKGKMGELDALRGTDPAVVGEVTPLIELLSNVKESERAKVLPALLDCAATLLTRRQPLWIDPHYLPRNNPLRNNPVGVFGELDQRIEEQFGLFLPQPPVPNLIPVVRETTGERELAGIRMLQEHQPRPIAIRLCKPHDVEVPDVIRRIRDIAERARVAVDEVHVIVDEQYVKDVDGRLSARDIAVIRRLADALEPASVALLSGCTPEVRKDFEPCLRNRTDAQLWGVVAGAVRDATGIGVRYGDYGIVPPIPKEPKGPITPPNPYVRYTAGGQTLCLAKRVPRNRPNEGAFADVFSEVADTLTGCPEFAGPDYSWGDHEFVRCRTGGSRRAGQSRDWLAMATSHHITHLVRGAA